MVSAACLASWQTVLACFFSPENAEKEKGQMDGTLKMQLDTF